MGKNSPTKEKIEERIEYIVNELEELDTDQHPKFYKNEPRGRKRTAFLLLKLNTMEKGLIEVR